MTRFHPLPALAEPQDFREILGDFKDLFGEILLQWREICQKVEDQNQRSLELAREIEALEDKIHSLERNQ